MQIKFVEIFDFTMDIRNWAKKLAVVFDKMSMKLKVLSEKW